MFLKPQRLEEPFNFDFDMMACTVMQHPLGVMLYTAASASRAIEAPHLDQGLGNVGEEEEEDDVSPRDTHGAPPCKWRVQGCKRRVKRGRSTLCIIERDWGGPIDRGPSATQSVLARSAATSRNLRNTCGLQFKKVRRQITVSSQTGGPSKRLVWTRYWSAADGCVTTLVNTRQ